MADTSDTEPQPDMTMVEAMGLTTLEELGLSPEQCDLALRWRRQARASRDGPGEPPRQEQTDG